MKEIIGMTEQELDRYRVLGHAEEKQLKQREAANLLGILARRVRNLIVR
jgi:predicted XRE-type DNA-binding protein